MQPSPTFVARRLSPHDEPVCPNRFETLQPRRNSRRRDCRVYTPRNLNACSPRSKRRRPFPWCGRSHRTYSRFPLFPLPLHAVAEGKQRREPREASPDEPQTRQICWTSKRPVSRNHFSAPQEIGAYVDAAASVGITVNERNNDNLPIVVETGINWWSFSGTIGNMEVRSISEGKSAIAFGGGKTGSSAGKIIVGRLGVIGGAVPISNKMIREIDQRVAKDMIP